MIYVFHSFAKLKVSSLADTLLTTALQSVFNIRDTRIHSENPLDIVRDSECRPSTVDFLSGEFLTVFHELLDVRVPHWFHIKETP